MLINKQAANVCIYKACDGVRELRGGSIAQAREPRGCSRFVHILQKMELKSYNFYCHKILKGDLWFLGKTNTFFFHFIYTNQHVYISSQFDIELPIYLKIHRGEKKGGGGPEYSAKLRPLTSVAKRGVFQWEHTRHQHVWSTPSPPPFPEHNTVMELYLHNSIASA